MAQKPHLTDDEISSLFSALDDSGVVSSSSRGAEDRARARRLFDPLSSNNPSGSHAAEAITRTAGAVIIGVLLFILILQVVYGVNRRLNTANLSETADKETVSHALSSGVEWGNGFTQFPETFQVEEADEKTGVVEVSVTDTTSKNELEVLSNSQIQAAALATNALLNDKINRVVYNVYVLTDRSGTYQTDGLFGLIKASGTRRAVLTFVWTKEQSEHTSYIDWQLKIIGMDDKTAEKIQEQVNSVSSLIDNSTIKQSEIEDEREERQRELMLHGSEIFCGSGGTAPTSDTAASTTDASSATETDAAASTAS